MLLEKNDATANKNRFKDQAEKSNRIGSERR